MRVFFIIIIAFRNESFENWMHSKKKKTNHKDIFFLHFKNNGLKQHG